MIKQLSDFLVALEKHYEKRPIIYATADSYKLYIAENFADYDLWIRNVFSSPKLGDNKDWTFWQYTNREILHGYAGQEKYIDMNVFHGTQAEFDNFAK